MGTAFPTKLHGPPSVPLALKGYESPAAERLSPTSNIVAEALRGTAPGRGRAEGAGGAGLGEEEKRRGFQQARNKLETSFQHASN